MRFEHLLSFILKNLFFALSGVYSDFKFEKRTLY